MKREYMMIEVPPLKILKASAGSGKTFSLTTHFLVFLFSGSKKYREILAVTFTNKATSEMKERVLSVLEGLAKGDSSVDGYREYILKAYPELSTSQIKDKARIIFKEILHDYGRFSISTIDKFVQQVVRSFNFELGIESGYRIEMNFPKVTADLSKKLHNTLDEKPELLKWVIDFAKQKIANNERWEYQDTLKKIAYEIFTEDFQRFEGVMKNDITDELFDVIGSQSDQLIRDFEVEIVDYFNKLKDLVASSNLSIDDFKDKSRNNIAKLGGFKEITIEGVLKHLPTLLKYIDDFDQWPHPKSKNYGDVESLYSQLNPLLTESILFYKVYHPNYQLAQLMKGNLYYLRLIREMSGLLADYRKENSLLLISDASTLLSKINEGQEDNPSFIWEKVGNRYKHFLFDEFQDTSRGQWNNFLPIVKNALSESSGERTEHLIVGDVKQSIYRWRSGDSRLLLSQVEKNLGSFFVENDSLLENYRSSKNIINFNNLIFDFAPTWIQKQANAMVAESPLASAFWKAMNYDDIIIRSYLDSRQNFPKNSKAGGIIEIKEIPVANNRLRGTQAKQEALQNTADALYQWIAIEKRYQPKQIGILVRTGKDAVALIDFLYRDQKKRQISNAYQVVSGSALLIANNDAIKLIINALELIRSKPEASRLFKANCVQLYSQFINQETDSINQERDLFNQEAERRIVLTGNDWIRIKDTPINELTDYLPASFCKKALNLIQFPLSEIVEQLIATFKLNSSPKALPYVFAFRDSIASFISQGDKGIDAFLDWWYTERDKIFLPSEEGGNVIQVVTIHKSKGLAYDVVMLPLLGWTIGKGIVGENLWVDLAETPFQQLEYVPLGFNSTMETSSVSAAYYEERLLRYMDAINEIYVALTRAKHHIFINLIGEGKAGLGDSFIASDIIRFALENRKEIPGLVEDELLEIVLNPESTSEDDESWSFKDYPQAQHLQLQLNKETNNQLQGLSTNKSQRLGILSHEVLSRTFEIEDIDKSLLAMQQEGLIKNEELEEVRTAVTRVLKNIALNELFSGPYQHLNEQDIIASGGSSYRPDKILINDEEAIIVDFKFTDNIENAHREQIENYKHLLSQMDIPTVKGYLFYGFLDQLVLV